MRILALAGSIALFAYIAIAILLTAINASKYMFADEPDGNLFWGRQGSIFFWPLTIISEEGRAALKTIWKKETE